MLTTAQITSMRECADLALPDTCTIRRHTAVSDGRGGQIQTWVVVGTYPCRLAPAKTQPSNGVAADKAQTVTIWTITLPAETDVRNTDQINIGQRVFEVDIVNAHSFEIARQVKATEIL